MVSDMSVDSSPTGMTGGDKTWHLVTDQTHHDIGGIISFLFLESL
jgi:hypothetical protein